MFYLQSSELSALRSFLHLLRPDCSLPGYFYITGRFLDRIDAYVANHKSEFESDPVNVVAPPKDEVEGGGGGGSEVLPVYSCRDCIDQFPCERDYNLRPGPPNCEGFKLKPKYVCSDCVRRLHCKIIWDLAQSADLCSNFKMTVKSASR